GAKACDAEAESRGVADPAVGTRESLMKHTLRVSHGEIGNVDLPHLRHHHEALTSDVECIRSFHVAGQHQHEAVAGTETVRSVHGTREVRLERRRRASE